MRKGHKTNVNQGVEYVLIEGILFERSVGLKVSDTPSCSSNSHMSQLSRNMRPKKSVSYDLLDSKSRS